MHRTFSTAAAPALAAILSLSSACGSGDDATAPTSSAVEPAARRIELPSPDWLVADDRHVYLRLDEGAVHRLDPATGDTIGVTDVGGDLCQGIGAGFGAVWTCRGSDVVRIDPATDEVVATIAVGKAAEQGHLAAGLGRVWVLVGDGSQLVGIDPRTDRPDPPIDLGVRGTDLDVDDDHVWVASAPDDAVVRVDPNTARVDRVVEAVAGARVVEAGPQGVWIGASQATLRLDPATLAVLATAPVGVGGSGDVAFDGEEVWIRSADPFLTRVGADGAVVEEVREDVTSGGSVLVAFGAVWATAYDDAALFRLPVEP